MTSGTDEIVHQLEDVRTPERFRDWVAVARPNGETLRKIVSRIGQLLDSDVGRAVRLSEWALAVAAELEDPALKAHAFRARGAALVRADEHLDALEYFNEALRIYRSLGKSLEVAKTLNNRISAYLRMSRYDEALEDSRKATDAFDAAGEEQLKAVHLINVGRIYFRLDRFEENLKLLDAAEAILARLNDRRNLCKVYTNRAVALTSLNRAGEAFRYYELAGELAIEQDMALIKAECDYNISYLYFLQGEYTKSLQLINQVREQVRAAGDREHSALCDLDQSEIYLELNMHDDAVDLAQKAYRAFEGLGMAYEMAKAVTFMGVAHNHLREPAIALELFAQARSMFRKENNQVWLRLLDLYQAIVYYQTGRYAEGLDLAGQAHVFFRDSGLKAKSIYALLLVARLEFQIGRTAEAEQNVAQCLALANDPPVPWLLYQIHFVYGEILFHKGELEAARGEYRSAIDGLELLRTNIQVDELRMTFVKDKLQIYEAFVGAALDSRDPSVLAECFDAVERAKSRTLVDLLANNIHAIAPGPDLDHQLVARLKTIREEINWYYKKIGIEERKGGTPASLRSLIDEARTREAHLLRLMRQAPSGAGDYLSLQRVATASLDEIWAAIGADHVLLEYYVVGDRIVAFAVTQDGLQLFRDVASLAAVRESFELFRFQLTKFNLGSAYTQRFHDRMLDATNEHLQELYDMLIAPVSSALAGRRGVIIVAHDFLHYLPFHALFDGQNYLIERFEFTYAPSATILSLCSRKAPRRDGGVLLVGTPDARTPSIEMEIEAIRAMMPRATVLVGADATAERFRRHSAASSLIHIASHGSFRQDNPMFSAIQLGDGWLNLLDIYNLQTTADFIVLSGCGTGMSSVVAGDELLGLVRGFLYAGARSLLVSLWDVHDTTTAELMQQFYNGLARGSSYGEALRAAMLDLRQRRPHPYFWAPFILIGSPTKKNSTRTYFSDSEPPL